MIKIPINVTAESTYTFTKKDVMGKLMQQADLLIIEKISMVHKHIFECLNGSLQDAQDCKKPFSGLTVLLSGNYSKPQWLANRAIIIRTNEAVRLVNEFMFNKFPGHERVYKSSDTVDNELQYPVQFIDKLTPSGFPTYIFKLKKGICILLLKSGSSKQTLQCLHNHVIEAEVALGPNARTRLLIPKIPPISRPSVPFLLYLQAICQTSLCPYMQ
uniref:ATP-dependent DNA helicase n=1 Tax=Octopus bimaculoides TaxID=37653 RepID=A0A0L8HYY2_OCTBM